MPRWNPTLVGLLALALALGCQQVLAQSRLPPTRHSNSNPDGVLEPWRSSDVACVEPGLVETIHVKLGDHVRAGEPLAAIDSASLRSQLAIAEAQAAARGRLQSVEAEVELNERKFNAFTTARRNEYGSQLEVERAEADLKIAQGRLAAELEEREILQLQVQRLKQQIAQRTVIAPIDGIVSQLHKELGEYVAPNTPEVIRIVDVSRLRASFFLQLIEVKSIPKQRRVTVELHDGERVPAEVEFISPVADGESGLIEVRVLIDNPEMRLLGSRCSLLLEAPQ